MDTALPDTQYPDVSVFVPAHNEEGNISLLADKIDRGCKQVGVSFEIIFVDDGSRDNTLTEMTKVQEHLLRVQIFRHRRRCGITETMSTAFQHVRGDIIIWIPADLESDPEYDIPLLLNKMKEDNLDVVCGWRQNRGDGKNLPSWFYNKLGAFMSNVKLHDMNWIKAFRRECLENLQLRSDWHRFLIMIWAGQGFRVGEVPTQWHHRHSGVSKFGHMGLRRMWSMVFDMMVVKFHLLYMNRPMLAFGPIGALIFGIGFVCGLYLLIFRLIEGYVANRMPFVLLSVFLMLAGIQVAIFGLLAEMIATIREDLHKSFKQSQSSGSGKK